MIDKFLTVGNMIFMAGVVGEIVGIHLGVHSTIVGWSLILYGTVLVIYGYLP